jgi:hypothetical protein
MVSPSMVTGPPVNFKNMLLDIVVSCWVSDG